jgi:hypothetical protein
MLNLDSTVDPKTTSPLPSAQVTEPAAQSDALRSAPVAAATAIAVAPVESTAEKIADAAQTVISDVAPFASIAGPEGQLAVVAASAALAAYKGILTLVNRFTAARVLTPAQQQAVYDAHVQLDQHAEVVFGGPEWQIVP